MSYSENLKTIQILTFYSQLRILNNPNVKSNFELMWKTKFLYKIPINIHSKIVKFIITFYYLYWKLEFDKLVWYKT